MRTFEPSGRAATTPAPFAGRTLRCGLAATLLIVAALGALGCASSPRRFDGDILREDRDRRPIEKPTPRQVSETWDLTDHLLFRPISEGASFEPTHRATNANALGRVPSSSWYTPRLSRRELSPERVARGPCPTPNGIDTGDWVFEKRPTDANRPTFIVRHAETGRRYLLAFGVDEHPERASAADVIGSKIFWAAGYHVPCKRIVYLDPARQVTSPGAPSAERRLRAVIRDAPRNARGDVRAVASRLPAGEHLGPFRFEGTRHDDPNDVVPHQDRRELRGARLFAAWIGDVQANQTATATTFVTGSDADRGYVRHLFVDWSDAMGGTPYSDELNRRLGHSYLVDLGQIASDYVTLGLLHRPWEDEPDAHQPSIFGYFDADDFDPAQWRPSYPNPAFRQMRDGDAFWAASILARFSDEHVRRIVARANFTDPEHAAYAVDVLLERRDAIVDHYLRAMSPLVAPTVDDRQLCLRDLLVAENHAPPREATYSVRRAGGPWRAPSSSEGSTICTGLPAGDYAVVEARVRRRNQRAAARPVAVHLRRANAEMRIAGIVRR